MMIKIKIKNKLESNFEFFIEWWNKKKINKRIKNSKEDPIIKIIYHEFGLKKKN
jgi:hypothetical protein